MISSDSMDVTHLVADVLAPAEMDTDEQEAVAPEIRLGAVVTGREQAPLAFPTDAVTRVLDGVKRALEHDLIIRRLADRITIAPDDLLAVLEDQLDVADVPARSSHQFSLGEEAALVGAGVNLAGPPDLGAFADRLTVGRLLATYAQSGTVNEAAMRLHRTPGRLRQRISDRTVYAFRAPGGEWRIPHWQFTENGLVPGLESVMRHLPSGLHPLSVRGFMLTPNPDLVVENEPVSPLAWLATGGDPEMVAALAADLPSAT